MDHINPNYLLVGALAIAGAFAVLSGIEELVSAIRSRKWPQVAGVVTVSKIVSVSRHQNKTPAWAPEIHYQYTVNNSTITGTLVRFGTQGLQAGREFAASYTDRYPVGRAVPVFYNPNRAEHAVLEPGPSLKSVWPMAIGLALLSLSVVLASHMWGGVSD